MHDLNNLIEQQSLIVKNAEKHKRNPEFIDDAMQTVANSVSRMKRVIDQLKRGEADRLTKVIELKFIVSTAVDRCASKEPMPTLDLNDVNVSLEVDAEQFTMVLTHLIQNAQDATPAGGTIAFQLSQANGEVAIRVSDSGSGMTPEFVRDHLFRPFDSTKGSQGMGIGACQAREFARKSGGELKVESKESHGATVTLTLPLS
jgi:putative PEP-CTERM system histidine kinase